MPIGSDTFFKAPLSKTPDSLLEHEGTSHLPSDSEDVHYEGEIVVVTGKQAENVAPEGAHEYILGVTGGNDITARDWQTDALRMKDAKACDTIGPFGRYIATGIIYGALLLKTRLNGKVMQEEQSRNLILDIPTLVSFANKQVPLMPQDVIYTGTPGKTGALKNGDVVEVEIDQVGVLRNTVGPTLVPSRS
jgi:2-keto-4-pentenoate hydratase/2-oxohepta-3-ene-1,7-dioic acid hydratase in catechol pathway